jgi:hypothetical protein
MMNTSQVRLGLNPILTSLFLGLGQGTKTAKALFPELPMALRGMTIPRMGTEALRRYDLARAPGADTRRVDLHWDGVTVAVTQRAVDIPIPRENIDEASTASRVMNVGMNLDISKAALEMAMEILNLDYEADAAAIATNPANFAAGNVIALAGAAKWSAATGTPVTDILTGRRTVRQKTGRNPNVLHFSALAWDSIQTNPQTLSYMSANNMRILDVDNAKRLFQTETIVIGDAVSENGAGVVTDVWGNNAILAFAPTIGGGSLAMGQPAFGTTNILKGHPFAETPWYDYEAKTWIYGATYERAAQITDNRAGFLFQNPF